MAHRKKTLAQKKKADTRKTSVPSHTHPTGPTATTTFSFSGYQLPKTPTTKPTASTSTMTLTHGLEKSLIVSSVIVILQLALFFLFSHHILVLPGNMIQY